MAGIRFTELVQRFIDTIERTSGTVLVLHLTDTRPARLRIITAEQTTECILLLWTITHGGGAARPQNERRIQMTNIEGIPLVPGVRTLLGGFSQEFGVYCFWDARRHTNFTAGSPSLQVDSNTLETAGTRGLATQRRPTREGEEVVVAVSPESLLWYVQSGGAIHNSEADADSVSRLLDATPEEETEFLQESPSEIVTARRHDLLQQLRAYRDARFRPAVLQAYSYRCAVCECDLKLVDAAHIIPVSHHDSNDLVTNGIALCRLHHGAYDNSLLGIQSTFAVVLNPEMIHRLQQIHLASALPQFQQNLPPRIRVPNSIEARPLPENLRRGLELRRWPAHLVV